MTETEVTESVVEEAVAEAAPEQPAPQVNKAEDRNWSEAREVLRLQKQRIEDLEARLAGPKPVEEPDEFDKLDQDDMLTVGKARKLAENLVTKKTTQIEQRLQSYIQQQTIAQDEQRMRSKHDDFDYVLENYAIPMIKNDPALAYKVQNSKNPAETAYRLAKISDEYEESQMKQQTSPKAEKILKNSSRPVSSNAAGSSLKTQADDFSKMNPSQVWEMSQKYAKGA